MGTVGREGKHVGAIRLFEHLRRAQPSSPCSELPSSTAVAHPKWSHHCRGLSQKEGATSPAKRAGQGRGSVLEEDTPASFGLRGSRVIKHMLRNMEIEVPCECQACGKVRVLEAGRAAGGRFRPTCPLTQPACALRRTLCLKLVLRRT